jgi:hypothetical protein
VTWATEQDVATYTGMTVTEPQIVQAQAIVELFADVTEDASDAGLISTKNLRLLRMAVSYQAAWMPLNPDLFTHHDAQSVTQDSVSVTPAHANAALLAPLAKRSIDRLSWRRNRGLRIAPMRGAAGSIPRRPLGEEAC